MKDYLKTWAPLVWMRQWLEYIIWVLNGKIDATPHRYKQKILSDFKEKFGLKILVETGTYLGDMVFAKRNEFAKIYSIELAPILFQRAKKRFAKYSHITILEGDSSRVLSTLSGSLEQPILFWLDGHYSGGLTARAEQDTPIAQEVGVIFENVKQPFVILIDDARLFVGKNGYPTLEQLKSVVLGKMQNYCMEVNNGIIIIFPK